MRKLNETVSSRMVRSVVVTGMIALSGELAQAQFRASIQGSVTDPQGAAIPKATLTLTDLETSKQVTATSNDSGVFSFNALPPDHFKLTVSAPGFRPQELAGLTIIPEQANAVNVQLALGDATTTVNVTADERPALDTETASISGTVDSNEIQHLPSAGRDVFQLVQLAPGVFGDGSQSTGGTNNLPGSQGPGGPGHSTGIFATENGPQANANGGQYETNGISIDGISTSSAVWGGTSVITPTEDSVGSIKVVSNAYDAENGRFSGAQIEVTSKSGTNQYHGSLYLRVNRPGLNAYQRYNGANSLNAPVPGTPFTPASRGLLRDTTFSDQYGGSVGGPILHNKLFAFFAYETQQNTQQAQSTGWYETQAFRALAPAGSIASKFLGFPGAPANSIGQSNISCAQAGFIEGTNCATIPNQGLNLGSPLTSGLGKQDLTYQNSSNPGVGSGLTTTPDIAFYSLSNPTTSVGAQYNGRLDSDVTKKDHVAFTIYWVPLNTTSYQGSVRAYNLFHHTQVNEAYTVVYNHIFSSSFLNEARVNDAGWRWNEVTSNPQEPFGLPTDTVDSLGTNGISIGTFGAPGPSNFNQHTYTYKDVATKVLGSHNIRFGGELTRLYYLNNPTYSARPAYNFYNIWDFLNDAPHSESGSFDPATGTPITNRQDSREDLYGFFVQDDWKARPSLTINAGLRYSYFGPLSSKQNNLNRVQLGTGATTFTGLSVVRGGNLTQAQKGNFGPQIGFAFNPGFMNRRFVVRGGYGLNYNQSEIAITGNAGGNPPNVLNASYSNSSISNGVASIDPRIAYAVPSNSYTLFGYPANPNAIGGFNAANLPLAGGAFITAFQNVQPTIYTQHFSLDTQIDLGHKLVASVGYQGSLTRHLIVQSFLYVNGFAQGYAQNPLVQNIDYYANTGHSNNNSLLLGLKRQMSHGLLFDAEFTLEKTMDTGSGPYYLDPYPYRPDLAYGRSDFNFGKAFKVYGLWQPVFFHGNSLLSKIADGFSLSAIYNVHTGFPFTPQYNVSGGNVFYASSPTGSLRPAAYLGGAKRVRSNDAFENGKPNINFPNIASGAAISPYFVNPSSGIPTTGTTYGLPTLPGVARNSFDGPGYSDVDATLAKSFGFPNFRVIGEGARLEIRADAFNLFNQTNLNSGDIVNNILSTNFGQAKSALAARVINVQARFSF